MTGRLAESRAWCRRTARRTARNFYATFLVLPSPLLGDMCVLYAFLRVSDDLGDDPAVPSCERLRRLQDWGRDLDAALAGDDGRHPLFPALVDLVTRHRLPVAHLHAVLEGIRRDQKHPRFATFDELSDYCWHVAGVVGLCCVRIWGCRDEGALESAVECGLAFQLTNILRDLREDAADGRLYLPDEDLVRFGCPREDVVAGKRTDAFRELMRFETQRARGCYARAERLFDQLEPVGRPILSAMMRVYGGLLAEIERRDFDVFTRRVALPAWKKALILIDTWVRSRCLPSAPVQRTSFAG